ncbi:MmgE/PrpD family protein [Caballeronia sp. LjRoot31]|uniref:MmgE/PrpD family protein n=1 Tax=Caballeronia sp. LjRoot31 TaxID=3342324 RepID=UPI003ECC9189
MSSNSISGQFAQAIVAMSTNTLPAGVVEKAKLRILDSLTTAVAAHGLAVPGVAAALVGENRGKSTIIGQQQRVPAIDAAWVNATLVNGRSQDDFLCKSHPGAIAVPAALAIAEQEGGSGADFIAAVVAGYEITGRVYLGGPGMLPKFRATGVAGTIGAAAAAARMLALDAERTRHALGCAAVFASGFGAGFLSGTMEVKLNVGMACRNGVSAALLAQAGATASDLAFEGEAGFYLAMAGTTDHASAATQDLGERYLLGDTVYKEYPVCIFVQTPMTLAREIAHLYPLHVDRIERVTVQVCELTYTNPGFTNVAPFTSALRARVSARFCVAAALLGKPIDEHDFYACVDDPDVLALAARIDLVLDPQSVDTVRVAVEHGGHTLALTGIEGETLRPSREKVIAKYRRLTSEILGPKTETVLRQILDLEHLPHLHDLMGSLRGAGTPPAQR